MAMKLCKPKQETQASITLTLNNPLIYNGIRLHITDYLKGQLKLPILVRYWVLRFCTFCLTTYSPQAPLDMAPPPPPLLPWVLSPWVVQQG